MYELPFASIWLAAHKWMMVNSFSYFSYVDCLSLNFLLYEKKEKNIITIYIHLWRRCFAVCDVMALLTTRCFLTPLFVVETRRGIIY